MNLMTDGTPLAQLRRAAARAPLLDRSRELELLRRIHEHDDAQAMRELLDAHLRLVLAIAAKYARGGLSGLDLVAEGNVGLVEAARRFDFRKDVRFATYAVFWIRARIGRYVLANRRIVGAPATRAARRLLGRMREAERQIEHRTGEAPSRSSIAAATGTTEDDVEMVQAALELRDVPVGTFEGGLDLAAEQASPEEHVAECEAASDRSRRMADALRRLDDREREIIERRYSERGETLVAIGHDLGISRERVRQLESAARQKLHAALAACAA